MLLGVTYKQELATGSGFTGGGSVWRGRAAGSGQPGALCILLCVDSAALHTGCPSEVSLGNVGVKPVLDSLFPMWFQNLVLLNQRYLVSFHLSKSRKRGHILKSVFVFNSYKDFRNFIFKCQR